MSTWKKVFTQVASNADDYFDKLKFGLHQRLGKAKPIQIVPYRGFGNKEEIYLKGRVLENRNILTAADNDTVWQNMLAMYKRFESNEIPGVQVQLRFGENSQLTTTDEEGYFEFRLPLTQPLPTDRAWHNVEIQLLDQVITNQGKITATGQIIIPPPLCKFGIISDVDDTILVSDATHILKMARLAFLNNARTRLPFAGVAAFYRALQSGPDSALFNPIFYVSSSPWNLYDLLTDFCNVQGIPKGPLMLRDLGISKDQFIKSSHLTHKAIQIEHILRICKDLPFVLIGDSGQHDPEIYRQVIKDYPGRIQAIYIRDVTTEVRYNQVQAIIREVRDWGVPMLLVKDTVEAALHAAENGLIAPEAIPDIRADKRSDERAPDELEQLIDGSE